MRLLFVSHSLPPEDRPLENLGGMQRVAQELDRALAGRSDIAYSTRFLRAPWKTVHLRSIPFVAGTIVRLWRNARRGDLDVVLFSSMVTASVCAVLAPVFRQNGVFTAAIVHGLDVTTPSRVYQWFVPRVFRAIDLVMPVSAATGEQCVARGLDRSRLRPVRNGVDLNRFPPPVHDPQERRRELTILPVGGVPADRFLLCSVGRQVRRKGFEWFIRVVMPQLPDDVHYWLAGDGPESEAIGKAIIECGLGDRVRRLGRVSESELTALYRGADVFVMPNVVVEGDMEGFGVVMLEAGLNGLPTVGSRLEGIAEVIEDGRNGVLVESRDADGFVQALLSFRANRQTASRGAYEYTRRHFSWAQVAEEYVETLRTRRNTARSVPS